MLDAAVVLLAVAQQAEIWASSTGSRAFMSVCALGFAVALLVRDRFPVTARVAAFVALGLWAAAAPHDQGSSASFFLGAMLAFWVAGLTTNTVAAAAGLAAGLIVMAYCDWVFPGGGVSDFVFTAVIQVAVWTAALAVAHRGRRARALHADLEDERAQRDARARQAVETERARIARELHDVIAHNLTVAVIQLAAAEPDLPRKGDLQTRVHAAEEACRDALGEMRRLLGVLHADETVAVLDPTPTLDALDDLVATTRLAGLDLEVSVEGARASVPAGVDLAAYRVAQEALTNALRHGQGPTMLVLRYRPNQISIEVTNQRRADDAASTRGSGRGLIGMRERVALYGGELDVGPDQNGGFRVAARLPLDPEHE